MITTPADIGDTVEKQMEGVVEKVIQEEDEKRAKDVVSFNVPHFFEGGDMQSKGSRSHDPDNTLATVRR